MAKAIVKGNKAQRQAELGRRAKGQAAPPKVTITEATGEPTIPREVPKDGGEAYKQGFAAAECPHEPGSPEYEHWHSDWDAAADEATAEDVRATESEEEDEEAGEEEEKPDRSVVKSEYRARYAEAGHPSHCGDELAIRLNNLCLTKEGIEMARFETICAANGVDLSKYKRTGNGWQGRMRMTGRNILAGKVFAAGGVLKTGGLEGAEPEYRMSGEWMASRRKTKTEEAA